MFLVVKTLSNFDLTLIGNLVDHVKHEVAFVGLLQINGAKNVSNSGEENLLNLLRWESSNQFYLETMSGWWLNLVHVNEITHHFIWIVDFTVAQDFLTLGVNGNFGLVWFPNDTVESLNFPID